MPTDKISPVLQTTRTVLALQQFSCYATLAEVHQAVCKSLGGFVQSYSIRRVLGELEAAKLVHGVGGRGRGCGKSRQYCWTGPCDLQDMQAAAAKRVSTPPATAKECVRQIAETAQSPMAWKTIDDDLTSFRDTMLPDAPAPPSPPARRGKWERKPLCTIEQAVDAVRACDGNKKAASEMLNVSEPTLYKYLKRSGVVFDRPSKRNRRSKRKPAVVGMPQRSRMPAISPPPPPAVIVREKAPAEPPRPAREQKPRIHAVEMLTAMHVDALWLLYKSDINNDEVRNELVTRYYYLVKNNAFKLAEKLPDCAISAEELYAPGVHGLIQAMEGFDLDRGLKFPTYAVRRIVGEMKDELRKLDWVPRLVRHGNTKIAKLTQKLNAVPTAEQLAAEYGCDVAAGQRMLAEKVVKCSSYFQDATGEHDAGEFGAGWSAGEQVNTISDRKAVAPSRRLSDLDDLRAITKGLNQDERLIIILYYYENQTMKEIGEQLLLSESRVSQMHSDMLQRLRARLTDSGRLAC